MRFRARFLQIISIVMVIGVIIAIVIYTGGASESTKLMDEVSPYVVNGFVTDRASLSTDRIFKKYYGLNAADYESVVLYFPISNMDAEELLIVKVKDVSQAEEVEEACLERQNTQIGIFEGYAPEQLSLCENAVLDVQGNYILYVVHENADAIDSAFKKALK